MEPRFVIYFLQWRHARHGQLMGFHFLNSLLTIFRVEFLLYDTVSYSERYGQFARLEQQNLI